MFNAEKNRCRPIIWRVRVNGFAEIREIGTTIEQYDRFLATIRLMTQLSTQINVLSHNTPLLLSHKVHIPSSAKNIHFNITFPIFYISLFGAERKNGLLFPPGTEPVFLYVEN